MGSQVERTHSKRTARGKGWARRQLADQARWRLAEWVVPHLHADKPVGTTGERDRPHNPGFQCGKRKPETLWL